MIRHIPVQKWSSVLEQFGREHRAWLATLHVVERGADVTRAVELPLKSATVADNIVQLDFLGRAHSLCAPRPGAMRMQLTETGAVLALEIDTLDGRFIRLAFRATALPEQIDGLAPGEVLESVAVRWAGSSLRLAAGSAPGHTCGPRRAARWPGDCTRERRTGQRSRT